VKTALAVPVSSETMERLKIMDAAL